MEKKTPLYDKHLQYKGKIVPYAGYLLPVQYQTGVIKEHMAVRTAAGLFDVSHMGEVTFTGKDALDNIQRLVTNDCSKMVDGQVKYSPMCNDSGGVVDDLLIYRKNENSYLVVVNAANRHKDVEWIKAHLFGDVEFTDISDEVAQLALQGPNSEVILKKLADSSKLPVKYYTFTDNVSVAGVNCLVSRTGYTGEDGYELYCKPEEATKLWDALMEAGNPKGNVSGDEETKEGLIPCGLGARDTLRLEAGMPLYGHEMDDDITPIESGIGFTVKIDKEDFIGKAALENRELTRKRVGLSITGRGIVRENCPVYIGEMQIGTTTSGTHCPYLGKAVAMALLDISYTEIGRQVEVEVRGRRIAAEVVSLPFYKR
ncbi:MAG: glycine cleavage system aminomethyltransferase GcvT [Clostridiales bacterium]|nr:glycine cleavage system aminomethyltransferase GcvT [Clostridiales bacterium]